MLMFVFVLFLVVVRVVDDGWSKRVFFVFCVCILCLIVCLFVDCVVLLVIIIVVVVDGGCCGLLCVVDIVCVRICDD